MKLKSLNLFKPLVLFLFIFLLGFVFANVEIQIEGPNGWATGLPTWRLERNWVVDSFWGGRPVTGYHVWVFFFMALAFHLPMLVSWQFSLKLEGRLLSCLAFFWIIEDFFWFALNPAFGLSRLTPEFAWWHKRWILGVPSDYIVFFLIGGAVYLYSFSERKGNRKPRKADGSSPAAVSTVSE